MKHKHNTVLYDNSGDVISVLQIDYKNHSWLEICLDSDYECLWTEIYSCSDDDGILCDEYRINMFLGSMEEDELFQLSTVWDDYPIPIEFIHQAHKMIKDLIQEHKSYKKFTYIDVEFEY